jgi:preprotein translocase SecF subunit
VFNLVKYRYLFLIISLIVIVPGTLSLIVKGLNPGIDFSSGAQLEFRPQTSMTIPQVKKALAPFHLQDLQVIPGDDSHIVANKTVWVRLNTQVDSNVQDNIKSTLTAKYSGVNVVFTDLPIANGKTVTVVTLANFQTVPQTSDIQNALSKLPDTSDPTKGPPSAVVTPTPAATGTPQASATGTPKATATAQVSPAITPTAAVAPNNNNNPANIPVSVVNVTQGTTTQTISLLTRTPITTTEGSNASPSALTVPKIQAAILNDSSVYTQLISNSEVGPSVAADTTRNAILAVIAASVFILLYVWFSFRKVAKAWRYGTCAIIAMLHDVLVVVGIFSILGWTVGIQVDALFITALLTVVGFSVHDTIVVFDRIRENMQHRTSETFEQVVNASLVQTMSRSLNTSLTVLFTLLALTLFGGSSIYTFTLALLIGIFSGTYSSIFNASMLLVIWEKGELGLWRLSRERYRPPDGREREARELARSRG